jgi:hypothetical protein
MSKQERAAERFNLNREQDRLITHLVRKPADEVARARLLEVQAALGQRAGVEQY